MHTTNCVHLSYYLLRCMNEFIQIQTRGQKIRGFKKIAGTSIGAWGLGCDHQVFVYIESSDLPIRCQVSSYENEVSRHRETFVIMVIDDHAQFPKYKLAPRNVLFKCFVHSYSCGI